MMKSAGTRNSMYRTGLAAVLCLAAAVTLPASALAEDGDGSLSMEIITAYNLVVDSNVESPSTYAPRSAYLAATFRNTGDTALTDVVMYIGDYVDGTNDTYGTYPSRSHPGLTGTFSLQHEGGSDGTNDARRPLTVSLDPGEEITMYWLVSYPNLDDNGNAVWGDSVKPEDDLWLEYDIWATANEGGTPRLVMENRTVTMRNEISAMANKIYPNTAGKVPPEYKEALNQYVPTWTNTVLSGGPGEVIACEGIWYDLGTVVHGFDNNSDGRVDQNAWLQPVGDPSRFDPSAFRLKHTYAMVVVKLKSGAGEEIFMVDDQLYFENLPDNNGAFGMVMYEYMVIKPGQSGTLTPYQEVASGYDNEKFNGDFGVTPPDITSDPSSGVSMAKCVDYARAWPGDKLGYDIDFTNEGDTVLGDISIGMPLVIHDEIPTGTYYVAGSAVAGNVFPAGITNYVVFYSTNNERSWQKTEPAVASNVTHLQWWLGGDFPTGTTGKVHFEVNITSPYIVPSPVVTNIAFLSFGDTAPFLWDDATTLILGTNTIGDTVFWDDGSGTNGYIGNGVQDGTETGLPNVKVSLYLDNNADGTPDNLNDPLITKDTDAAGTYLFTNIADGTYVVAVDEADADIPYGSAITLPVLHPVSLDPNRTNVNSVVYLDADFGFCPVLDLTKDLVGASPIYEGDYAQFTITVTNRALGDGGLTEYYLWGVSGIVGRTANKAWVNETNAWNPDEPDGLYAVAEVENAQATIEMTAFDRLGDENGEVLRVELVIPTILNIADGQGNDDFKIDVLTNITATPVTIFTTNLTLDAYSNMIGGLSGDMVIDLTDIVPWSWADFNTNNSLAASLTVKKGGGVGGSTIMVDSAAFRVLTDWKDAGTDPHLTMNPVPMWDTYDADRLEYVCATNAEGLLWPKSVTVTGTAPNSVGTIYWDNIGPIYPSDAKTLFVTYLAKHQTNNAPTPVTVTNYAVVSNVYYADGRPVNNADDTATVEIQARGRIGDFLWWDTDGDGTQDAGEAGLEGWRVVLTAVSGPASPATNYTDANGEYWFNGLPTGETYTVTVDTNYAATVLWPAGVPWSVTNTYDEDGNLDNATTIVLTNRTHDTADFGYRATGTVSWIIGTVWNDMNMNGAPPPPDTGEPWLTNVTVYLFAGTTTGPPATAIATNYTDTNGYFSFVGNFSGDYTVQVVTNTGQMTNGMWTQSYDTDGLGTPDYATFNVPAGGFGEAHFSYYQIGSYNIGDELFYDWDGDGTRDPNDDMIPGVTVKLYMDMEPSQSLNLSDLLLASNETTAAGYLFTNLLAGDYLVVVDPNDPELPDNYAFTADPFGVNDGFSALALVDSNRLDQDFGVWSPLQAGVIGDFVWIDSDGDGYPDTGEMGDGISNITVTLWTDWDSNGVWAIQATNVTDTSGYYWFTNLPAGSYRVDVDANDSDLPTNRFGDVYLPTTSTNHYVTLTNNEVYLDADFGFCLPGTIGDTIFWDANTNGTEDIPYEKGIGGVSVWLYIDVDDNNYYSPGTDTLHRTETTDADGEYLFTGLVAASYIVMVDTSSAPIVNSLLSADPDSDGIYAQSTNAVDADNQTDVELAVGSTYLQADFGYTPTNTIGDLVWLDTDGDGIYDEGQERGIGGVTIELWTNGTAWQTNLTSPDGWYFFYNIPDGSYTIKAYTNTLTNIIGAVQTFDAEGPLDNLATNLVILSNDVVTIGDGSAFTDPLGLDFGYKYQGSNLLSGTIGIDDPLEDGVMGAGASGHLTNETPWGTFRVTLSYWADRNADGTQDVGEVLLSMASALTATNGDYSFSGLPEGTTNDKYIITIVPYRGYRLTTTLASDTPASEVVDARVGSYTVSARQVVPVTNAVGNVITNVDFAFSGQYDFGDLPNTYNTVLPIGPRHGVKAAPDLYLGASVDAEGDGQPSANADGDGADEDGVSKFGAWRAGTNSGQITFTVGAGEGYVLGYADFSGDGDFIDSGELISTQYVSGAGVYTNYFNIPAGSFNSGTTTVLYTRFRIFEELPPYPVFAHSGDGENGEVEDYRWEFGAIGDYVWKDLDSDGIQDPGETGITNVRVFIDLNADGIFQATEPYDITDSSGIYGIGGLCTGSYTVVVDTNTLPSGYTPTYDIDGIATPHKGVTNLTTDGEVNNLVDFGYLPPLVDVGVGKTVNDSTPPLSESIVYTMIVTNFGPIVATGVEFTDVLPVGVTYTNHSVSTGYYDNVSGVWTIGTMQVSATATMKIYALVNTNVSGMTITNWIRLTAIDQADSDSSNNEDDAQITPTLVVLSRFEALNVNGQAVIEWETAAEHRTVGFFLFRREDGEFVPVNEDLLPSVPGSQQGGIYRVADPGAEPGKSYRYLLVEAETSGHRNRYGPVSLKIPERPGAGGPRAAGNGRRMAYGHMSAEARQSAIKSARLARKRESELHRQIKRNRKRPKRSDLPPVKLVVTKDGVVSLAAGQIAEATGMDQADVVKLLMKHKVVLSNNGEDVAYAVSADGTVMYFYGEQIDSIYTGENVYWLSAGAGKRMFVTGGEAPDAIGTPTVFGSSVLAEEDRYPVTALVDDPQSDYWMWEFFMGNNAVFGQKAYSVKVPGLANAGNDVLITLRMQGASSTGVEGEHITRVSVNGTIVAEGSWDGTEEFVLTAAMSQGILSEGENTVEVTALTGAGARYSVTYLDSFEIAYDRTAELTDGSILMAPDVDGPVTVGGLGGADYVFVWDVTDPKDPVIVDALNASYDSVSFHGFALRDYAVCAMSAASGPASVSVPEFVGLASVSNDAEYVIITVPELAAGAEALAAHRRDAGLKVRTVMLEDVYNEFGAGIESPAAIKAFLAHAFERWSGTPRYVVLAGEGTFDYKDHMGVGDCLVPAALVSTPWGMFASDNWFVDFDDDLVPELPVGRLPVMSEEEFAELVDKIVAYETAEKDDWQTRVLLAADDPDSGGNFTDASELIAGQFPESYEITRAYLEGNSVAATRNTLIGALNEGVAFMNYQGHSGLDRMAAEGILTVGDVPFLENGHRQPIVTSMSCVMGRFALPGYDCMGEAMLLHNSGGSVAVWSPTGSALNRQSRILAEEFYGSIFAGQGVLGDATLAAMREYAERTEVRDPLAVYGLLGDPALKITGRLRSEDMEEAGTFGHWNRGWFKDGARPKKPHGD